MNKQPRFQNRQIVTNSTNENFREIIEGVTENDALSLPGPGNFADNFN